MARHYITVEAESSVGYEDEILHHAQQIDSAIPKQILDMQAMYAHGNYRYEDKVRNFYQQGVFMADYEDDTTYTGMFDRPFPVYHDMRLEQLRGYFGWRSRVRKGEYVKTNPGFCKVYLYELMNLIGVRGAEEACEKIEAFYENYLLVHGESELALMCVKWLKQMAVMYQMDEHTCQRYFQEQIESDALYVQVTEQDTTDETLYASLLQLGMVKAEKGYDAEIQTVLCDCWRLFVRAAGETETLLCLGKRKVTMQFAMFSDAIVWMKPNQSFVYQVDPQRIYRCQNGIWDCTTYWNAPVKKGILQTFWKEVNHQIHIAYQIGRKGKETNLDHAWKEEIAHTIRKAHQRFRKQQTHVDFDLGSLSSIRQEAVNNMHKLLTEEEKEEMEETGSTNETGLSKDALYVLEKMIQNESYQSYIAEHHLLETVLFDEINEMFLEEIGDTVIVFEKETALLEETYRQDVIQWIEGVSEHGR